MKKLCMAVSVISVLYTGAMASPYFRPIDLKHPNVKAGAFFDASSNIGDAAAGTSIALITHSPKDGCLLPSVVCEDWSPLTFGGTFTGPKKLLAIGPSFNLSPLLKAGALSLVNSVTKDGYAKELKDILKPSPNSNLRLSLATDWAVAPQQNWKGYFKFFIGPAWSF